MNKTLFDLNQIPAEMRQYFEEVDAKCGAPWERVVERESNPRREVGRFPSDYRANVDGVRAPGSGSGTGALTPSTRTTGWAPTCSCGCDDVTPCVVLDPFAGSGTSLRVAMSLGRSAIGVDMSETYLTDLVPKRTSNVQMQLAL